MPTNKKFLRKKDPPPPRNILDIGIPQTTPSPYVDPIIWMRPTTHRKFELHQTFAVMDKGPVKIRYTDTFGDYDTFPEGEEPPWTPPLLPIKRPEHGRGPLTELLDEMWAKVIQEQQDRTRMRNRETFLEVRRKRKTLLDAGHQRILKFMGPDWYQELSNCQRHLADELAHCICKDLKTNSINNTRENLARLGLVPRANRCLIRKALRDCYSCPIEFLLILYQYSNPNRSSYSINDRLILSSVVHLTMASTLREMHVRIPSPPPKPERIRGKCCCKSLPKFKSPYQHPLPVVKPPDKSHLYGKPDKQYPKNTYFCYLPELRANKIWLDMGDDEKPKNNAEANQGCRLLETIPEQTCTLEKAQDQVCTLEREQDLVCTLERNSVERCTLEKDPEKFNTDPKASQDPQQDKKFDILTWMEDDIIRDWIIAQRAYRKMAKTNKVPALHKASFFIPCLNRFLQMYPDDPPPKAPSKPPERKTLPTCTLEAPICPYKRFQEEDCDVDTCVEKEPLSCCSKSADKNEDSCPTINCLLVEEVKAETGCVYDNERNRGTTCTSAVETNAEKGCVYDNERNRGKTCTSAAATNAENGCVYDNERNRGKTCTSAAETNAESGCVYDNERNRGTTCTSAAEVNAKMDCVYDNERNRGTTCTSANNIKQESSCILANEGNQETTCILAADTTKDSDLSCTCQTSNTPESEASQGEPCTCREKIMQTIEKFEKSLCQCEWCVQDRFRAKNKITTIISGTLDDPKHTKIIGGVQSKPRCNCMERYKKRWDNYEKKMELLKTQIEIEKRKIKYIIGGTFVAPDGKVGYIILGTEPKTDCPCARLDETRKEHEHEIEMRATVPPTCNPMVLGGVQARPDGNVFIVSGIIPTPDCKCQKMLDAFEKQHDYCMELYEQFLKKVKFDSKNYFDEMCTDYTEFEAGVWNEVIVGGNPGCPYNVKCPPPSCCEQSLFKLPPMELQPIPSHEQPLCCNRPDCKVKFSRDARCTLPSSSSSESETPPKCKCKKCTGKCVGKPKPSSCCLDQTSSSSSSGQQCRLATSVSDSGRSSKPCRLAPSGSDLGTPPKPCRLAASSDSINVSDPSTSESTPHTCTLEPKKRKIDVQPAPKEVKIIPVETCSCTCKCCDSGGSVEEEEDNPNILNQDSKRYIILEKLPCDEEMQVNLTKKVLDSLAKDGYPLAMLPDVYRLPHFKLWMNMRCGKYWTIKEKFDLEVGGRRNWRHVDLCRRIPPPINENFLKDSPQKHNWRFNSSIRKAGASISNEYYAALATTSMEYAREFFATCMNYEFPTKSFRDVFFAFLAPKMEAVTPFKIWQSNEWRDMTRNKNRC